MKKTMNNRIFILLGCVAAIAAAACSSQDDIYKEWVVVGGYDYPAKALNLNYTKGYQRLIVNWERPMDPAVKTARLYWNNYVDSVVIDYADYPSDSVSVQIGFDEPLEDRSYTFYVVNLDDNGNRSLESELIATPYGDSWLTSRSERSVYSAKMDGSDAKIVMSRSTDEMISTKFRYKNNRNDWVELEQTLQPGETEITFPNALQGKKFQYASAFCASDCIDTVWRSWQSSASGISYQLSGRRWTVTATSGQVSGENTQEKVFDGIYSMAGSWYSAVSDASKNVFPKILAVDTGTSSGNEYAFTEFEIYQHSSQPTMRYVRDLTIYVGSSAFDPNETDYVSTFGIPFLSGTFTTSSEAQSLSSTQGNSGRYIAFVFRNSWDSTNGYINVWEIVPYGYLSSDAD